MQMYGDLYVVAQKGYLQVSPTFLSLYVAGSQHFVVS